MIQTSALPSILKKLTTTNNRHRLLIESHSLSMWLSMWVSPNDKPCIWGWLKYVEIPAMVIWIEDGANSIGWIQKNESRRKHPYEIPLKKSYEFPLIPYEILMKNPFLNPKNHFHISHTHTRIHRDFIGYILAIISCSYGIARIYPPVIKKSLRTGKWPSRKWNFPRKMVDLSIVM